MDYGYDDFGYQHTVWYGEWTKWFAWYPVRLFDPASCTKQGDLVWLKRIKCRLVVTDLGRCWQYVNLESDLGS